MLCCKVLLLSVLCFAAVNGMPQDNIPESAPPLLEFKNGGLRFNFGGYHAEAGLGGLLGGSKAGGGLHASAGTPWGAHAAAGLGGILGGDNANAGGRLYARAGLGPGRHAAAAGLGGFVDGSGRSGAMTSGEIYAGATTGAHGVGVSTAGAAGPVPSASSSSSTGSDGGDGGKSSKGRTNIQIIAKSEKNAGKTVSSNGGGLTEGKKQNEQPPNKEVVNAVKREPDNTVSVFGDTSMIPKAVEVVESLPPVPLLVPEDNAPRVRPAHSKWFFRKKFWGPRKQYIWNSAVEPQDASEINTQRLSRRQLPNPPQYAPAPNTVMRVPNENGPYDDIFQIPIATLNAVNQLLNNNSG